MKEELIKRAMEIETFKIERFLRDALRIKKLNFWTKLKLKIQRVEIKITDLGDFRKKVEIFRKGRLTDGAEFSTIFKT